MRSSVVTPADQVIEVTTRRAFIRTLAGALLAAPLAAEAQRSAKVYRIGLLIPAPAPAPAVMPPIIVPV
jgi:hypothetical protein